MSQPIGNQVVQFAAIGGEETMTLGRNLARLRKARGWTQDELSRHAKVPVPSIRRYEVDRYTPNAEALAKIAKGLGCSIDEIVFGGRDGASHTDLTDPELLRQFEEIQRIPEADREPIKRVLESVIVSHKLTEILPTRSTSPEASTAPSRRDVTQFLDQVAEVLRNPRRRGPRDS